MSITLIIDRTSADTVRRVALRERIKVRTATGAEWSEWLAGIKGAYNTTDLNRVGSAIAHIASHLTSAGYSVQVSPKTDWTISDIPTPAQMTAYLSDVAAIRAALAVGSTTPPVPPDMDRLTVNEANDIERILVDVDGLISNMISNVDTAWAVGMASTGIYAKEATI